MAFCSTVVVCEVSEREVEGDGSKSVKVERSLSPVGFKAGGHVQSTTNGCLSVASLFAPCDKQGYGECLYDSCLEEKERRRQPFFAVIL